MPNSAPDLIPRFDGTVALVYDGMPLDKLLLDLIDAAHADDDYNALLQVVNEGGDLKKLRAEHPAKEYKSIWDRIGVFNGPNGQCLVTERRIIVPRSFRAPYVNNLHDHHPSADASWLEARSKVWWPGIKGQLKDKYDACLVCQEITRIHYETPPPCGLGVCWEAPLPHRGRPGNLLPVGQRAPTHEH